MRLVAAQPVAPATASPACPLPTLLAPSLPLRASSPTRLAVELRPSVSPANARPTPYSANQLRRHPQTTTIASCHRAHFPLAASPLRSSQQLLVQPAEAGTRVRQQHSTAWLRACLLGPPGLRCTTPFFLLGPCPASMCPSSLHSLLCLWLRAETRLPALPMGPGPPALPLHRRGGPRQHG